MGNTTGKTIEEINDKSAKQVNLLAGSNNPTTTSFAGKNQIRKVDNKFNKENVIDLLGENKQIAYDQDTLQQQMDDAQSNWSSGFNAVVGGIGSGLATAVEDLSYIPQLIKQQQGSEGWEKNAIAEAMQGIKADIGDAMPLYTADENGMSFWEGVKGVTDSAIGFGLPGGLIGKGIGAIGKTAKAARIAAKLYKISKPLGRYASVVTNSALNAGGAITSGLIMNDLEGSMMGVELYDNLIQQGHSKEDAAFAATKFKNANRAFAVSDMIQVSGLFGGLSGATRNTLTKKGIGEFAKKFTKLDTSNPLKHAIGEAGEEIGQGVLSNEFEYQANKDAGFDTGDKSDYIVGRALDYALTKEAMFEGAMGFFGGGPQALISHIAAGEFNKGKIDEHNAQVDNQAAIAQEQGELVKQVLSNEVKFQADLKKAMDSGNIEEAQILKDSKFADILATSFENGSADQLEANLEDITEMSTQEAKEAGFSENYKEEASERIAELKEAEKVYLENYNHPDRGAVILNRMQKKMGEKISSDNQSALSTKASELQSDIDRLAKEAGSMDVKNGSGIIESTIPSYEIGGNNSNRVSKEHKAKYDTFKSKVEALGSYQVWNKLNEKQKSIEGFQKKVTDNFDELMKPENQDKTRALQEKFSNYRNSIENATDPSKLNNLSKQVINDKSLSEEDKQAIQEAIQKKTTTLEQATTKEEAVKEKVKEVKEKKETVKAKKKEIAKAESTETPTLDDMFSEMEQGIPEVTEEEEQLVESNENAQNKAEEKDTENVTFDNKTTAQIDVAYAQLEKDLQESGLREIRNKAGEKEYEYDRTENSFNIFAYLSRQYKRVFSGNTVTTEDINDEINDDEGFFNKNILDPKQFPIGTKLTIEVDEEYSGDITHPITKEKISWEAFKAEATEQEITDNVPIKIVDSKSGETISYLHSTSWANETNIYGNVNENTKKTRALRESIQKGPISSKIMHKSAGKLFKLKSGEIAPTSEMMPDEDLDIHVATSSTTLHRDQGVEATPVLNSELVPGATYIVIDTHNGEKMALPVYNTKVGDNADIKASIISAVRILTMNESTWSQADIDFKGKMEAVGIDLTSNEDVNTYISKFIHNTVLDNENIRDYVVNKKEEKVFFNISPNSVSWARGGEIGYVSRPKLSENDLTNDKNPLSLSRVLNDMYLQPNKKFMQDSDKILTITPNKFYNNYKDLVKQTTNTNIKSVNIGTDKKPNWVYTLQPVIEFATSEETSSKPEAKEEIMIKDTFSDIKAGIERRREEKVAKVKQRERKPLDKGLESLEKLENNLQKEKNSTKKEKIAILILNEINRFRKNATSGQATDSELNKLNRLEVKFKVKYGLEIVSQLGKKYDIRNNIDVANFETGKTEGEVSVHIREVRPQVNKNGVLVQRGKYDVMEDITQEEADSILKPKKSKIGEINAIYDEELDALEKNTSSEKKVSAKATSKEKTPAKRVRKSRKIVTDPAAERAVKANKEENRKEGKDDAPTAMSDDLKTELAKASEGIVVKGFTSSKQEKVTNTIKDIAINEILKSKKSLSLKALYKAVEDEFKKDVTEKNATITNAKDNLDGINEDITVVKEDIANEKDPEELKALNEELNEFDAELVAQELAITNLENSVSNHQQVLDNFIQLSNITTKKLESIGLVNINSRGEALTTDLEKTQFTADDVTRDSRETVSAIAKRFLSGLDKKDSSGEVIYNYLGYAEKVPFDEVYSTLQSILTNSEGNFQTKIAILQATKDSRGNYAYPWMEDLINKLVFDSTPQLQTQFTIATTQHYVNMEFVVWDIDKNGKFVVRKWNADSASKTRALLGNWKAASKVGALYNFNEKEDEYLINGEEVSKLKAIFDSGAKGMETNNDINAFLEPFGIKLDESTILDLRAGTFRHNGKKLSFAEQFTNANGIFNIINKKLLSKTTFAPLSTSNILDESVFKSLAKHDSNYRSNVYATSFRDGGKSISSNANNKYITERVSKIKTDLKYVEKILNTSYGRNSELLRGMVEFKVLDDESIKVIKFKKGNDIYKNFNYAYAGFNPYQQLKSNEVGDTTLQAKAVGEHEAYKLNLFLASTMQDRSKTMQVIIPTNSDKSTSMKLTMPYQKAHYLPGKKLSPAVEKRLYKSLFLSEYNRILAHQVAGKKSTVKSYKDGVNSFIVLPEMNTLPGLFDENGNIERDVTELKGAINGLISDYVNSLVDEKLSEWDKYEIGKPIYKKDGKSIERHNHIDSNSLNKAKNLDNLALDMVSNYLVANSEYFQTIVGDPAQFFKGRKVNPNTPIEQQLAAHTANSKATFDNISKRLAGEIAPGMNPADIKNQKIKYLMLKDRKSTSTSMNYLKSLKLNGINDYTAIEGSDAQEFTTIEEHLDVMLMFGKITEEEHLDFLEQSQNETLDFTDDKTNAVFQPVKPVYVNSYVDTSNDLLRRLYVKSSSFPLVPQLTKGLEIDKVRIMMEDRGINRAAFSTAVKVGNTATQMDLWEKDGDSQGTVVKNVISKKDEARKNELLKLQEGNGITKAQAIELEELNKFVDFDEANTLTVSREGFKIQQEIPFKDKEEITKVTQASKLILVNMLGEDFAVKNLPSSIKTTLGKETGTVKGKELQEAYYELYHELYKTGQAELNEEILTDNVLDKAKLTKLLLKEAQSRNYPLSVQQAIVSDPEFKYLPYSIYSEKFEALLNSIVSNKVIKQKLPGRSFVLGTEEGFQNKLITGKEGQDIVDNTKGMIFTDTWSGSLESVSNVGDKMKPTQIFLSSKFKMNNGSTLNLREKVDGKYRWIKETTKDGKKYLTIDYNKIDPEVLRAFGMRIPNQGPNSTANMEIAGFLPESMADLVIASRDFTIQMGSDFDIDKLYAYQKFNFINKEDKLVTLTAENKDDYIDSLVGDKEESRAEKIKKVDKMVLKNDIVDIHLAVASNPSNSIQAQMAEPLGFGNMKEQAAQIEEWRSSNVKSAKFTGFSDKYQRDKYISGASGNLGIGLFSLDSVTNALTQGKELRLVEQWPGKDTPAKYFEMNIGGQVSNGFLSDEKTLDGSDTKSNVISWYQSAAVDNANENLMGRLNINKNTMDTIRAMNQLGFKDETTYLITQDIIFDYIDILNSLNSSINDFSGDVESEAIRLVNIKYASDEVSADSSELTIPKMKALIKNGVKEDSYNELQRTALEIFLILKDKGKMLASVSSTLNVDTAGLGKSIIHSMEKENQIETFEGLMITNIASMIGKITKEGYNPTTINGFAIEYGLKYNNQLWESIFPYKDEMIKNVFKEIEDIKGNELTVISRTNLYTNIWRDMKSALFANEDNNLADGNIFDERKRLLIDSKENESLAAIVTVVKELDNPLLRDNAFFQRLNPKPEKNSGKPATITINSSSREALDEEYIYTSLLEMLQSKNTEVLYSANGVDYTVELLAQDLIAYQMLIGGQQGPTDFTKYIPNPYLKVGTDLIDNLSELDFNKENPFGFVDRDKVDETNYHMVSKFTTQFFQHNPYSASESKEKIPFKGKLKVKPVFVREGKGKDLKLFKWDGGSYIELPLLGQANLFEYSSSEAIQYSVNKNNNPNNKVHIVDTQNKKQVPVNKTVVNPYAKSKNSFTFETLKDKSLKGIDKLEGVLSEIATHPDYMDTHYGLYSELLLQNFDKLTNNLKFTSGNNSSYDVTANELVIGKDTLSSMSQEEIVLHELTHAMTSKYANAYDEGILPKDSKEYRIMKSLDDTRLSLIKKLSKDEDWAKGFKELQKQYKEYTESDIPTGIEQELIDKYYAFYNLKEFITMSTTNAETQKVLNKIPRQDKQSWVTVLLEKFRKAVANLLGIKDLDKDMELHNTLSKIYDFIQSDREVSAEAYADVDTRIRQLMNEGIIEKNCD